MNVAKNLRILRESCSMLAKGFDISFVYPDIYFAKVFGLRIKIQNFK
jgi:hypothetical protein